MKKLIIAALMASAAAAAAAPATSICDAQQEVDNVVALADPSSVARGCKWKAAAKSVTQPLPRGA